MEKFHSEPWVPDTAGRRRGGDATLACGERQDPDAIYADHAVFRVISGKRAKTAVQGSVEVLFQQPVPHHHLSRTVAASGMAQRKTMGHLSQRVALRFQSLEPPGHDLDAVSGCIASIGFLTGFPGRGWRYDIVFK